MLGTFYDRNLLNNMQQNNIFYKCQIEDEDTVETSAQ